MCVCVWMCGCVCNTRTIASSSFDTVSALRGQEQLKRGRGSEKCCIWQLIVSEESHLQGISRAQFRDGCASPTSLPTFSHVCMGLMRLSSWQLVTRHPPFVSLLIGSQSAQNEDTPRLTCFHGTPHFSRGILSTALRKWPSSLAQGRDTRVQASVWRLASAALSAFHAGSPCLGSRRTLCLSTS